MIQDSGRGEGGKLKGKREEGENGIQLSVNS